MRWFALARGEGMKLLLVLAGVVLAGCTTAHVTRYTWASADPNLKQADIECLKETNKTYVPGLYGGGKAIRQTLYKDCIEQRGYAKLKTEDVPPVGLGRRPQGLSPSPAGSDLRSRSNLRPLALRAS